MRHPPAPDLQFSLPGDNRSAAGDTTGRPGVCTHAAVDACTPLVPSTSNDSW